MKDLKELITQLRYPEAISKMIEYVHRPKLTADDLLSISGQIERISTEHFLKAGFQIKRLAVLGGYTTHYITRVIQAELLKERIFVETYESKFGLFEQAVYAQDPELILFSPDVVYFCVGTENLDFADLEAEVQRWAKLCSCAHQMLGCEIILNTFEEPLHRSYGNLELKRTDSPARFVKNLNLRLGEISPFYVHLNDIDFLSNSYGRQNWRDETLYDLSKVPVSFDYLTQYAESVSSVIGAIFGRKRKCLVLDLDNTLWGGVVGDDGVANIAIGNDSGPGEAFLRFQSYLKKLKNRGVILAVCSKNNEATAQEPFLRRMDMLLKLEDFSCFIANWEPKSENLIKIAQRLNLGLDSLVFVDDNPAEREIVRQSLPQVAVIDLPEDPAEYSLAVSRTYYFDAVAISAEDLQRTQQYHQNSAREVLLTSTTDYGQYLQSLNMNGEVETFSLDNLPRITQLINKTNQFNLTTRRFTESEVNSFLADPRCLTSTVKLSDRFGDSGLISALIAEIKGEQLEISTWVMSCRVLKRGVELLMMQKLFREAAFRNIAMVVGHYIPTEKNLLVKNLYSEMGFEPIKTKDETSQQWFFDLRNATKLDEFLGRAQYISERQS